MFANLGYDEMNKKNKENKMSFLDKIKAKAKEIELENLSPEEASKKLEEAAEKLKKEEEERKRKAKEKKKLSKEQAIKNELENILSVFYNGLTPDPEFPLGIILLKKNPFYKGSERQIVHAETLTQLEEKINKILNKNSNKRIFIHYTDSFNFIRSIRAFEYLWDRDYIKIKNNKIFYKFKGRPYEGYTIIKNGIIDRWDGLKWFQDFYNSASEEYDCFEDKKYLELNNLFSNQYQKINFTRIIEIF